MTGAFDGRTGIIRKPWISLLEQELSTNEGRQFRTVCIIEIHIPEPAWLSNDRVASIYAATALEHRHDGATQAEKTGEGIAGLVHARQQITAHTAVAPILFTRWGA